MAISDRNPRLIVQRSSNRRIWRFLLLLLPAAAILVLLSITTSSSSSSSTAAAEGAMVTSLDPYLAGLPLIRRSVLAVRSDPLRERANLIRKQAGDHAAVAASYASYARKLKLENSKQVRLFAELSRNFSTLLASARPLLDPAAPLDEAFLRRFEHEVKDRIRAARQLITDAKDTFDNQLKIQKLKDTIFAVNEQLSKAKKQGAFSSLIAAKSIPKSLHCLAMRLMEERIAHSDRYADPPSPPHELDDPRLYHYAIFSDNVLAASVVVNSAVLAASPPHSAVNYSVELVD